MRFTASEGFFFEICNSWQLDDLLHAFAKNLHWIQSNWVNTFNLKTHCKEIHIAGASESVKVFKLGSQSRNNTLPVKTLFCQRLWPPAYRCDSLTCMPHWLGEPSSLPPRQERAREVKSEREREKEVFSCFLWAKSPALLWEALLSWRHLPHHVFIIYRASPLRNGHSYKHKPLYTHHTHTQIYKCTNTLL